ncbi:hypothetical protein HDU76_000611 [Blyttiomyces sp. JEL0837]|nr:hypothetical protein HDU76_000611 [Blyttiomyces sp. JEL0837]
MSTLESNRFYIPIEGLEPGEMDLICKEAEIKSKERTLSADTIVDSLNNSPRSSLSSGVPTSTTTTGLDDASGHVSSDNIPVELPQNTKYSRNRPAYHYDIKAQRIKKSKYHPNKHIDNHFHDGNDVSDKTDVEDEKLEAHRRIYGIKPSCGFFNDALGYEDTAGVDMDMPRPVIGLRFTLLDFVDKKSRSILCEDVIDSGDVSDSTSLSFSPPRRCPTPFEFASMASSCSVSITSDTNTISSASIETTHTTINLREVPLSTPLQVMNVPLASDASAFGATLPIDAQAENPRSIADETAISESIDNDGNSTSLPKKWWIKVVEFVSKMVKKVKKAVWPFQDVLEMVEKVKGLKGLDEGSDSSRLEETVAETVMDHMSSDNVSAGGDVSLECTSVMKADKKKKNTLGTFCKTVFRGI